MHITFHLGKNTANFTLGLIWYNFVTNELYTSTRKRADGHPIDFVKGQPVRYLILVTLIVVFIQTYCIICASSVPGSIIQWNDPIITFLFRGGCGLIKHHTTVTQNILTSNVIRLRRRQE